MRKLHLAPGFVNFIVQTEKQKLFYDEPHIWVQLVAPTPINSLVVLTCPALQIICSLLHITPYLVELLHIT